jgi:2,3-bisphosphoglycerate-independent phosphoglycerate mutase
MPEHDTPPVDRRRFLGTATATAALAGPFAAAHAADDPGRKPDGDGRPPVTDPRATSGDTRHGPRWDERFTLTVGNDRGDLCGRDQRVIQAAVDTVARMGGGTVRLLPGTFRLRNAVYLCSNLRLVGSGPDTVLVKEPSATSKLAADSDWYDQEITLADASGFRVGDGICLRAKNPHHGGATVIKRTLVARTGNRFKLDRGLRDNLWSMGNPVAAALDGLIRDGDGVIFFNFRADRARELTRALAEEDFKEFPRKRRIELATYTTMTQYDETFKVPVAYAPREIRRILGEVTSQANVRQLRIAETEKYAHVTYFFNGGEEKKFPGEERILIPSPRDVATYDLKPEMSAREVTEALVKYMREQEVGLVIANYANADMVGHTGNFEASVRAVEVIDECLGRVVDAATSQQGRVVITADHGNIEQLIDYDTGMPHTAHTTNLVPVILVDEERRKCRLAQGSGVDIAPTVLQLLRLAQPQEMTGRSLIVNG